jgi:hypothetical protein
MADQCPLCERPKESRSEFCNLHSAAFRNLESAYSSWNKAYDGKLTKEEYLTRITGLPETGASVKEVIQHLRGKGAVT